MIKSAKRAVYDESKNADINDEELLSAFAGAEDGGMFNSWFNTSGNVGC